MGSDPIIDYRNISYWFDSLDEEVAPQPPTLIHDDVDVAIVGAGFTGLWTAYYLHRLAPELDIALYEQETVGFGASGRNGGWCLGIIMGIAGLLRREEWRERALAFQRLAFETVDEVGAVTASEGIECEFAKGGTLRVATTPFHADSLRAHLELLRSLGFGEDDYRWLPPETARGRINTAQNHGALWNAHCAALNPAKLARGIARVLRARGVAVHERTPVRSVEPGRLETAWGPVRAKWIVRATEGYTSTLRGEKRTMLPLYSMVVATEPLPAQTWNEIGLAERETFTDERRITIYGQRTGDGRMVFGGRAGYYFGSRLLPTFSPQDRQIRHVERTLTELFPVLRDCEITHRWGGLMGVPRHWRAGLGFDRSTGIGWAGGYVGEGVAASNLAARTLADLILERDTELAALPWVNAELPRWEPEPLRWLGVKAIEWLGDRADARELATGRPSAFWGGIFDRVVGW
jgi:glycine/D-amino acid oxidase-like deaminating enzyme